MRIGMIAPPWLPVPPSGYGGIETVVSTLSLALAAAGHEVVLAAAADSTCAVTRIAGFTPSNPDAMGMILPELRHVALAYAALDGVDVIHDHTLIGPAYNRKGSSIPVVTTVHGAFSSELLDIYRALPTDVAIVAISEHQASMAVRVPITRVIHHGVDASAIPVGNGAGGYVCFLGRMNPEKGVLEAIRIARLAGIPLRIAAKRRETREREYFDEVIRPYLGPDVEYLGELNSRDKYELLGSATALLNPIQWDEPFGMVMIEALATGTPVVTTSRGSAPEIVDDGITGFVRATEGELADALANVHLLDRSGCRRAVETRFSAERMAAEHVELYSRLIR